MSLHHLTPRPPMGWNSFDCYGCVADEAALASNLEVFIERLAPHGYTYFCLDAGWYREYQLPAERRFPTFEDTYSYRVDEWGRPATADWCFPRGLKPLIERAHEGGVKFGLHMMRGIPKVAVERNLPVKGTPYRARDIGNPESLCPWCPENMGVDATKPGAQAYYDSIIELLAGWGVDFIKYDDIIPHPPEVELVANAIERCGREIVLSLSPGNRHVLEAMPVYSRANIMRITGDVWDSRSYFTYNFDRWAEFLPLLEQAPEGFWLDQDMIPFGHLAVCRPQGEGDPAEPLLNGRGTERQSAFTRAQMRTFITMQAVSASPLIMGGDLPTTDEYSFELITHPEVLACNQNGVIGRPVRREGVLELWQTTRRGEPGSGWLALFNRQEHDRLTVSADASWLGLPAGARLRSVWEDGRVTELDEPATFDLAPDDVLFASYETGR